MIFDVEPPATQGCVRCGRKEDKEKDKSFCNLCVEYLNDLSDLDPKDLRKLIPFWAAAFAMELEDINDEED